MFTLSSISRGLESWLVNHTSIHENFELQFITNVKVFGEISSNSPNNLLGRNLYSWILKEYSWILLIIVVANITMD